VLAEFSSNLIKIPLITFIVISFKKGLKILIGFQIYQLKMFLHLNIEYYRKEKRYNWLSNVELSRKNL
jgi:hypothetical protein